MPRHRASVRTTALPAAGLLLFAAALLAVLAPALPACAAEQTRTLEQSFRPDGDATLSIANLAGRVRIEAGSGDAVKVVAVIHAEGDDDAETRALLAAMKWVRDDSKAGRWALSYPVGDYSRFTYPSEHSGFLGWGSRTSTRYLGRKVTIAGSGGPTLYADLTVTYPARIPLEVRQIVGHVDGGELYGELTVDTGSADVEIDSFNGKLTVDTGSGDVEVGSFRGDYGNLDTGSGDVVVSHVDARRLRCDTGSGDVTVRDGRVDELEGDTGSGEITIDGVAVKTADLDTGSGDVLLRGDLSQATRVVADTGSGDVEIYGGPDASFRVTADQGSGELEVGYSDAKLEIEDRKVVGATRGDGRTRILIDTGSGDAVVSPG